MRFSGWGILGLIKRQLPLSRQAKIAARLLPPGSRFRFALAASRWQGRFTAARGGNGALTEAVMRDHWLRELTFHGAFPIPYRLRGREVLDRYAVPGPVLYYTTHLPMAEIPLRVVMELGYPIPVPVADPGRIVEQNRYLVTGMEQRILTLPVNAYVLARVRRLLLQGISVVLLADNEFAGELSANPLRLAARLRVPVVISWAELASDGVVDVSIHPAPHPYCESEQAIEENLAYLREVNEGVLRPLGVSMLPASGSPSRPRHHKVRS